MIDWNLQAAWAALVLGFVAGSVHGLFFHREGWWGGYASWPRRVARLGHVSLIGLALVNVAFAYTVERAALGDSVRVPSLLLVAGAFLMPLVCYLAAWRPVLRHVFVLPVLALVTAAIWTLVRLVALFPREIP